VGRITSNYFTAKTRRVGVNGERSKGGSQLKPFLGDRGGLARGGGGKRAKQYCSRPSYAISLQQKGGKGERLKIWPSQ